MRHLICLSLVLLALQLAQGQNTLLVEVVDAEGHAIPGALGRLTGETALPIIANNKGLLEWKELPPGKYHLELRAMGFLQYSDSLQLSASSQKMRISLQNDRLQLEQVVVTATRSSVPLYNAPVVVSQLGQKTFDLTQSVSLAEGLQFSPGLRVENNCQNCGFTQLRINGLDGAYSQILINSRPVFSALAAVYGLEMIPANMIERVEVVKGGGSALYGGNAIGGTVNILTRDPMENAAQIGLDHALIRGSASDQRLYFNASLVGDDLQRGIHFYGNQRMREGWDANNDGFTELTEIKSWNLGFNSFWKISERKRLDLQFNSLQEYRRGGSELHLPPHQAQVAEQLQHRIQGVSLSYEWLSANEKHRLGAYSSVQQVQRDSYYGAGGRILSPGDSLTPDDILALNAYGNSDDLTTVWGAQYGWVLRHDLKLSAGIEQQFNEVTDEMPGYERKIHQTVNTLGSYLQVEWDPTDKWCFVLGSRLDQLSIQGNYLFQEESYPNQLRTPVWVPRLSALYRIHRQWRLRASYAEGYRSPQAFNEDLHIETVGGAARIIRLDPALEMERSRSYSASIQFNRNKNQRQLSFILEGFHTQLLNPFLLVDAEELPNGISQITKRNGSGAYVQGINAELKWAWADRWMVESGFTLQRARFTETEVLWTDENARDTPPVETQVMLRTPNVYGFLTAAWDPKGPFLLASSLSYTGSMTVSRLVEVDTERPELRQTPDFVELNLKMTYDWTVGETWRIQWKAGIHNLLDAYQNDFDSGPDRDAGYVYGPLRPRTVFLGFQLEL